MILLDSMIISPPFLPPTPAGSTAEDPLMDELDAMTDTDGVYPIAFDRRWHTGLHLIPSDNRSLEVRAIADGEVVAYRACQKPVPDVFDNKNTNAGFVLLKHTTETGENRKLTFYSLYMHLLDLDAMSRDGIQPPPVDAVHSLPTWLRKDTGGPISGRGKKMRRKDIIGYAGQCQGKRHLHFEIFMAKGDFDAYFRATRLGHREIETPPGSDCWGHSYYVIPPNQHFYGQPPGVDAKNKLRGIEFAKKQGGRNERPLYVEVYFHKGDKCTNVWSVSDDGSWVPLTTLGRPVVEPGFEYSMYKRASALYPTCPSDGYELLRFGRILSKPETLPPVPNQEASATQNLRTTWYCIPFASGQQGYVDISTEAINKLSDSDFPFFMGWQKLQASTAPVDEERLWDLSKLKTLVRTSIKTIELPEFHAMAEQQTTLQKNEAMRHYLTDPDNKAVRELLSGFICEAPSEWDSANLDPRYRDLVDDGGHFEGDQVAYDKFLDFAKGLQFWGETEDWDAKNLPIGGNVWFFHPLKFIRYLRRCGWIGRKEFEQIYADRRYGRNQNPEPARLREMYLKHLNFAMRKFGMVSGKRQSHFLGQGAVESGWLASMQEASMLGRRDATGFHGEKVNSASKISEADLGHWYGGMSSEYDAWFSSIKFNSSGIKITGSYDWKNGNCDSEDAQKFRGRGFKQLTGRSNYASYWVFRGWLSKEEFTESWWSDREFKARNRSKMKSVPASMGDPQRVALPENCIDSGGFYLTFERPDVMSEIDKDVLHFAVEEGDILQERKISRAVTRAINGGYNDEDDRLKFTRSAKEIIL
ncbi:peptidase M23 [Burkholderia ambifaria]|uniref:peptidase M23 n=1 Tax=Burkholderia ambifaria TaxID=152480 RepID=UPI00158E9C57|nr:peptidase M23 [Burkholderia ambifaria]